MLNDHVLNKNLFFMATFQFTSFSERGNFNEKFLGDEEDFDDDLNLFIVEKIRNQEGEQKVYFEKIANDEKKYLTKNVFPLFFFFLTFVLTSTLLKFTLRRGGKKRDEKNRFFSSSPLEEEWKLFSNTQLCFLSFTLEKFLHVNLLIRESAFL